MLRVVSVQTEWKIHLWEGWGWLNITGIMPKTRYDSGEWMSEWVDKCVNEQGQGGCCNNKNFC